QLVALVLAVEPRVELAPRDQPAGADAAGQDRAGPQVVVGAAERDAEQRRHLGRRVGLRCRLAGWPRTATPVDGNVVVHVACSCRTREPIGPCRRWVPSAGRSGRWWVSWP